VDRRLGCYNYKHSNEGRDRVRRKGKGGVYVLITTVQVKGREERVEKQELGTM